MTNATAPIQTARDFYALNIPTTKIANINRQLEGYPIVISPYISQDGGVWKLYGYEANNLGNKQVAFAKTVNELMETVNNMINANEIRMRPYA